MTETDQKELQKRYDALICYAQNILKNSPHVKSVEPKKPAETKDEETTKKKVCIIGGGIGGLYAAMLLQDLGIPFEVLEADSRFGGRLFTYSFGDSIEDYYDVGALCFPEMPVTKSVFKLIDKLELRKKLIVHALKADNNTLLYNSVLKKRTDDCVKAESFNFPDIPSAYSEKGWPELVDNAINPFDTKLINDAENKTDTGYEMMMKYDKYSIRSYLSDSRDDKEDGLDKLEKMPYPMNVVNWCETLDRTIGRYSDALTERVIERLALAFPSLEHVPKEGSDVTCYRINGGSSVIIEKMKKYLEKNKASLKSGRIVRRIAYKKDDSVEVSFLRGEKMKTKVYDHVIVTTTIPCLRCIDLQDAGLDFYRSYVLRSIKYGNASRVGIKFEKAWWEDSTIMTKTGVIKDGQSFSDNMTSAVIYTPPPADSNKTTESKSEASDDDSQLEEEKTRIIVTSFYSIPDPPSIVTNSSQTTQPKPHGGPCRDHNHHDFPCGDFQCYAGVNTYSNESKAMKQMVLRDLALSHGLTKEQEEKMTGLFLERHSFSWDIHPFTMGAFPRFGPGQFKFMYENLTRPAANGRLHFAGEAASIQHSWISGTLSASRRAVEEILYFREKKEDLKKLTANWGEEKEWDGKIIEKQVQIAQYGVKETESK